MSWFLLFQSRHDLSSGGELGHPEKLPKTRPSNPRTRVDAGVMSQSCPTPPQSRRKFFLMSPKGLRSPFMQRIGRQPAGDTALSGKYNTETKSNYLWYKMLKTATRSSRTNLHENVRHNGASVTVSLLAHWLFYE